MSSDETSVRQQNPRIEMADPARMNDAQRQVYDKIVAGKRGKVIGPLRVALHSPDLADRWQALGEFLRFETDLPATATELAIITTGRYWNSQVEWVIHARIAAEAGLAPAIIEAIRCAQAPAMDSPLLAAVYDFTCEVLEFGHVSDAVYAALSQLVAPAARVELTAIIGYYSMVAMTLNVHEVPVPENENALALDLSCNGQLAHPTRLPKCIRRDTASGARDV
ncbi:MAG: carboxymuconolactone decarboxylase family protein [Gammaproteobacteria bacterium]|nr:carboxymuconolactone decarboxylase family protein [Gammaproteobacteria bacterium]